MDLRRIISLLDSRRYRLKHTRPFVKLTPMGSPARIMEIAQIVGSSAWRPHGHVPKLVSKEVVAMKLSNLINKVHQTFARVFLEFNLFDSLFPHHAARQSHRVNLKNGEQMEGKKEGRQGQSDVLEVEAMECWYVGPGYTWCRASRMRN